MGGKTVIALGLITGVVVGAALVGGVVVMGPGLVASEATLAPATTPASVAPTPAASAAPETPAMASEAPDSVPPASEPAASGPTPSNPARSSPDAALGVGEPAPQLVVPKLGGGTIDLATLRGKPVWVYFIATSCSTCRDELPLMEGFAARYADQGLQVVLVDVGEDAAAVEAFMKGLDVDLPTGLDTDGAAQDAWGAVALPAHFWVDADGIVQDGAPGGIGPDVMVQGLEEIMPGVTVTP